MLNLGLESLAAVEWKNADEKATIKSTLNTVTASKNIDDISAGMMPYLKKLLATLE